MRKIGVLATIALLLISCSNEENVSTEKVMPTLGVTATIDNAQKTKASMSSFKDNDQIAVFVNGTNYTPVVSKYTLTSSVWNFPMSKLEIISLRPEEATVYAYYPADATLVGGVLATDGTTAIEMNCPAEVEGFKGENLIDYLYNSTNLKVSAFNIRVNLTFKHALSKLTFAIDKGFGLSTPGELTKMELQKPTSFKTGKCKLKVSNGTIDLSGATNSTSIAYTGTATLNNYNSATPSTNSTVECIVIPNANNSDITLCITVDGVVRKVKLPIGTLGASWEAGKNYKYVIQVYDTEINITPVSIEDWTDGEVIPPTDLN